jgi:putative transposase
MDLNLPHLMPRCLNALCHKVKQRLRRWTKPDSQSLALNAVLDLSRSKSELVLENALLRRQVKRPALTWHDRALFVLMASKLATWKTAVMIVQPETLLRWHRDLFRWVWRHKSRRKGKRGREPLGEDIVNFIKNMAKDNRSWGAERIRGELLKLGVQVAKSTIQKYIGQVRTSLTAKQTWATFLRNHAKDIWAVDFLQTYDLFFRAIFVFVVIKLGSRRLVHFGVTRSPSDAWVAQQLREATPFGEGPRFLIRDNDNKYGAAFDRAAKGTHIDVLKTPYQAPKANAICERFLGSVRRECLDLLPNPVRPHPQRAPSIQDHEAVSGILQSRPRATIKLPLSKRHSLPPRL